MTTPDAGRVEEFKRQRLGWSAQRLDVRQWPWVLRLTDLDEQGRLRVRFVAEGVEGAGYDSFALIQELLSLLTTQAETIRRLEGEELREWVLRVQAQAREQWLIRDRQDLTQRAEAAEGRVRELEQAMRAAIQSRRYVHENQDDTVDILELALGISPATGEGA